MTLGALLCAPHARDLSLGDALKAPTTTHRTKNGRPMAAEGHRLSDILTLKGGLKVLSLKLAIEDGGPMPFPPDGSGSEARKVDELSPEGR